MAKRIYLGIILYLICNSIYAQQNISLADIEKAYKGDFNLSAKAVYKYFPDYARGPASDSLQALIIMHGNDYYFTISDFEIVREGQYVVSVDHSLKSIEVLESPDDQDELTCGLIEHILSQQNAKVSSFSTGNDMLQGIRMNYQNNEIIQSDLYVDVETKYIKKCIIKYVDGFDDINKTLRYAKIEVIYSDIKVEDKNLSTEHNIKKFISLNGNTITLNNSYKSYELLTY